MHADDNPRDDLDDDSSGEWPTEGFDQPPKPGDSSDEENAPEVEEFVPPTHVFFENEPLIRTLNDPARGDNDPELAKRLFGAILQATLIALVPDEQELGSDGSGEIELEGDLELSFVLVRHPDVDGDIVPMFTDEGALASFLPDGGRYVALAVKDLFPLLGSGGLGAPNIVINPGGDEALLLTPRMVQDLIDAIRGYGMQVVSEDTEVEIKPAAKPMPDDARRGVITILKEHEAIVKCTQMQWFMPARHEEPALVLAIELEQGVDDDARKFALASLWRDLSPLLRTLDRQVEMVDVDGQREIVGVEVDKVDPIYVRDEA